MAREEEDRFSELETGLSFSEERGAPEFSSVSTPHKAGSICCALKEKDVRRIRNRFQFLSSVRVRISNNDDWACHSNTDEVCFYKADFVNGLHFPIHPFIRELFFHLLLAPAQLVPNSWRIVICCMVVWMSANDGDTIRIDEFLHFYRLRQSKIPRIWEFKPWDRNSRLILDSSSSLRNWKMSFYFVSSEGWETVPSENSNDAPRLLCSWGTLVSAASFYYKCICTLFFVCMTLLVLVICFLMQLLFVLF